MMQKRIRTGDQNWVREHNLAIVMNNIWQARQAVSRADLVEKSGLNKGTVGSLVDQLQSWQLVKETGLTDPRPGRPARLIDIDPDGGRLIGVEIGVDFISVALTDLKANIVWRSQVETNGNLTDQQQVLEGAGCLVQQAVERASDCRGRLFGIGLGVPGLVDHAAGTLLFAPNLKWSNVPLREMWAERFRVPVMVDNDAKAAALGEQMVGVARDVADFVYLNAGVGLGSGVVIDGDLYRGADGFAGAIGHMTIEPEGPPCNCGNRGCWETLVGPRAIVRQIRQAAADGRLHLQTSFPELADNPAAIKMQHILSAAERGDPAVLAVLEQVGRYLGIGIANVIYAYNPTVVVLGGALSLAGPYILPSARAEVDKRTVPVVRRNVRIVLSAFKFDACVVGAATLMLREILNNPTEAIRSRERSTSN